MRENMKEKNFFNYRIIRKENTVTMKSKILLKKKGTFREQESY